MKEANKLDGWQRGLPVSCQVIDRLAIFLDVDGTLLDLAPTPDSVVVPSTLLDNLIRLQSRVDGAVAIVSGRSLDYLRALLPGLSCAMAGLHGAETNTGGGTVVQTFSSVCLDEAKAELVRAAGDWPGVIVEDKGSALAAHFRLAPGFAANVETLMIKIAGSIGESVTLQRGKSVIEIRPAGSHKGLALEAFMELPAFCKRAPFAIGDDLTDECMFASAQKLGGISAKVGPGISSAITRVESPAAVRAWIESLVQ